MTTKPMTAAQAEVLNSVWEDVIALITHECTERRLHSQVDEILSDAITRTCAAIAKHGTEDPELIKSRARSCALDAIKTAARVAKNVAQYRAAVSAAAHFGARHNGETMISPSQS